MCSRGLRLRRSVGGDGQEPVADEGLVDDRNGSTVLEMIEDEELSDLGTEERDTIELVRELGQRVQELSSLVGEKTVELHLDDLLVATDGVIIGVDDGQTGFVVGTLFGTGTSPSGMDAR